MTSDLKQLRQAVDASNNELENGRDELERIRQKIDAERQILEQVQKEVSDGHRDLQLLVDAINKRNLMLETLDVRLESEITRRRQDLEASYKHRIDTLE